MTLRNPLVLVAGEIVEKPAGDTIAGAAGGSVTISTVTVDFGSTPVFGGTFTLALAGVVAGQKVLVGVSSSMPAGVDADELEMDGLDVAGAVLANDFVTLIIAANPGPITGQRNFNLITG